MKFQNKLTSILGVASLGVMALTSCEGGDLYSVGAPDWIAARVDSIAEAKKKDVPEELNLKEDVYTIGKTDFSSGWWADFSKYYQIPAGEKLQVQFNLNINPDASNTYKNYAMIITNDVDRGGAGYAEYGAIRFDNQPSGNSEWGDYIDRAGVESTLTFSTDTDPGVDKLGGKVTVTVDRSQDGKFYVEMNNGTVVKKYTSAALPNLNPEDLNSNNIRVFFCVEGSYINWIGTSHDPIGGCTSKEDKQPISMTLKGIPGKVLAGTEFDDIVANVTATVEFETGVSKVVEAKDLSFQVIPDLNTLGTATLVAAYSKTYKGEGATKPVIANVQFQVVDKMYTTIGDMSCTTPFWGSHSAYAKVAPGETAVSTFTNYTSGASNWNNFCVVLTKENAFEYAVVRADNFGWGAGYEGIATAITTVDDWGSWLAAMNGAKVNLAVTNVGDGTANILAVMTGTNGEEYVQTYEGIAVDDPEDFYYHFTVDNSCIVFDEVIGDENNSGAFWSAHSGDILIAPGATVSRTFTNYTSGNNNWNNFVVVLCAEGGQPEYGVVRADNYGWGAGYDGIATANTTVTDWGTWLAAMDGAYVKVSVTNNGDNTADVVAVMIGNNAEEFVQEYTGIQVDSDNLWFNLTIDGCHLVFE